MKILSSISFMLPFSFSQWPYLCCFCCYCSRVHKVFVLNFWVCGEHQHWGSQAGSGWWDQGSGSSIADAPSREVFHSRSLWAKLRAEASSQVVVMALSSCSFNKAQEVMTNTNISLREKYREFCTADSVSKHSGTSLLWLCLKSD